MGSSCILHTSVDKIHLVSPYFAFFSSQNFIGGKLENKSIFTLEPFKHR